MDLKEIESQNEYQYLGGLTKRQYVLLDLILCNNLYLASNKSNKKKERGGWMERERDHKIMK